MKNFSASPIAKVCFSNFLKFIITAYFRSNLSYFVINYVRLNYIDITKHTYYLNLNDYGNNGEISFKE
jgi:hypothetical protein